MSGMKPDPAQPVTCLLPRIPRDWKAVAQMMVRHFGEDAAKIAWAKVIAYNEKDHDFEAARAWEPVAGFLSSQLARD